MTDETLELELAEVPVAPAPKPRKRSARKPKGATAAAPKPARWVLTNRFNLIEILSSRLIAPRESYRQYYVDLLADTPNGVPVFSEPPGPGLRERVTADGENNFAVLLQLGDDVPGDVVVGGLPLSCVVAVHFPDAATLRDHQSRPLGNVPATPPLHASPELFGAAGAELVPRTEASPVPTDWASVDRARGAVAGMTAVARTHGITARSFASFVERHAAVVGALTGVTRAGSAAPDPDDGLALGVLEVLSESDPASDWSPRRLVKSLMSDNADRPDVARNLEAVRQIVSGERDFSPFRSGDTGGLISAKALLMVLLRPRLDSLLAWDREDTNADDGTLLLSGALAGWMTGVTRLPAEMRDVRLDDATAAWACQFGVEPIPPDVFVVAEQDSTSSDRPDLSTLTGREVGVATRLGVRVLSRVEVDAAAELVVEDGHLVITTSGPIRMSRHVDKQELLAALRQLPDAEAAEVLSSVPLDHD